MLILHLIESIRERLMVIMSDRLRVSNKWFSQLCPKKDDELRGFVQEGSHWIVSSSFDDVFEVRGNMNFFVVMLDQHQSSCVQWKHKSFHCAHVLQVILHNHRDIVDFVDDY